MKKILIVRTDNMGDVLMTEPAIRSIRQHIPTASITLLTSHAGSLISPYLSGIDQTLVIDVPWAKHGTDPGSVEQVQELIQQLRQEQYDCAVLCTTYSQNPLPAAMICYLAGVPRIAGYCRENPYFLLSDWIPDPEPIEYVRHEVERQLALLTILGVPAVQDTTLQLNVPKSCYTRAASILHETGVTISDRCICLHVGVSEDRRAFSIDIYIHAARQLAAQGYSILCTGSSAEQDLVSRTVQEIGAGAYSLAGALTVGELCAVLDTSQLLIANNTGPVHIAAAMQTPVVVVYARTNPQHAPWNVRHRVLLFDVPPPFRSKNKLLEYTYPDDTIHPVSAADIVHAAESLLTTENDSFTKKVLW